MDAGRNAQMIRRTAGSAFTSSADYESHCIRKILVKRFISAENMGSFAGNYTQVAEVLQPDDPFFGPVKSIAPWTFKVLAGWMAVITAMSLSENFLVILVTYKFKQLRQPLNFVIVNLAVADFFMSLIGGTLSVVTNHRGYFFLGSWACVLEGFAVTFFGK